MDHNTRQIKDILQSMVKKYQLDGKLDEVKLKKYWEEIVGKQIAKNTINLRLEKKKLFIELAHAALKHEIHYIKTPLIERINKRMRKEIVKEIIVC